VVNASSGHGRARFPVPPDRPSARARAASAHADEAAELRNPRSRLWATAQQLCAPTWNLSQGWSARQSRCRARVRIADSAVLQVAAAVAPTRSLCNWTVNRLVTYQEVSQPPTLPGGTTTITVSHRRRRRLRSLRKPLFQNLHWSSSSSQSRVGERVQPYWMRGRVVAAKQFEQRSRSSSRRGQ
jgi:hypothetical protein